MEPLTDPVNTHRGVPYLPKDLRPTGEGHGASWKGRKRKKGGDSE